MYFKTQERYFSRRVAGDEEMRDEHQLDLRHDQILALGRLYRDRDTPKLDDRAAAIEIQVDEDIGLERSNLIGVVIPNEYKRIQGMVQAFEQITDI